MFKKSKKQTSPTLFSGLRGQLTGKKLSEYTDPLAWHNVFKNQITIRIDEAPFGVLYSSKSGRGNSPIRLLVAMNILKEGHGWSDRELFSQCDFNILVMNALGLNNIDDQIPVESTWYLFRQKLYEYQIQEGKDLIGDCFAQLTKDQADYFGVTGDKLRMDSKLIGSNIVRSTRLELVINCLRQFYKSLKDQHKDRLIEADRLELEKLGDQKAGQITYRLNSDQQKEYLYQLGELLARLVEEFDDSDNDKHGLLRRILTEQYNLDGEAIEIKPNDKISSNSLQSAYDQDAAFRRKTGQKVQGYSVNVTETCNDKGLNLIADVKVEKANYADVDFVEESICDSQNIVGIIKQAYMDGAYNSIAHAKKMKGTTFNFSKMQGPWGQYQFKWDNDKLIAIDTQTGIQQETLKTETGKFRIINKKTCKAKYRYFQQDAVASYFRRVKITQQSNEVTIERANVEATIFQLCYLTRNNKTRYRGKFKHQLWSKLRALWINLRRIFLYLTGEKCPEEIKQRYLAALNGIIASIYRILMPFFTKWERFKNKFEQHMIGGTISPNIFAAGRI